VQARNSPIFGGSGGSRTRTTISLADGPVLARAYLALTSRSPDQTAKTVPVPVSGMDRRAFVAAVTAGAAALAGCSGGETTPSETPTEDTPRGTGTPTDSPTPTEEPTPTDTPTAEETPTETPTPTPDGVDAIVEVGPDASLRFAPESVEVPTGATVRWTWRGNGHNVSPRSTPDGADWSGTSGSETFDAGHSYEHTFDTAGTYEYACDPHEASGMTGEVVVASDVGYDAA